LCVFGDGVIIGVSMGLIIRRKKKQKLMRKKNEKYKENIGKKKFN